MASGNRGQTGSVTAMETQELQIREQIALAPLTTLGVGGPARFYALAHSPAAVADTVDFAHTHHLPLLVLGRGSNVLVGDDGYAGIVLRAGIRGVHVVYRDGKVDVTVGAGEHWHGFVCQAVAHQWAGLECLAGIPGLVGATPIQNVGAYGQEVRETIVQVTAFDLITGQIVSFDNAGCGFGYRESRFKRDDRGRYIILTVTFRLTPGGPPAVRYIELERLLAERGMQPPTLADVRAAVLEIRRRKAMLIDRSDHNTRSAGSFFVNPVISRSTLANIEETEADHLPPGQHIPVFNTSDDQVKLPAAWLIERVGFSRGYTRGPVGLSERHTLAIINRGGATAHDILNLARDIRHRVRDRYGITLQPEPTMIGVPLDAMD